MGNRLQMDALRRLISLLCALVLTAAVSTAKAQANPLAQALIDQFHVALKQGDQKAALQLLDDEALIFESGYAESKRDYAAHHLASDIEFARRTVRLVKSSTARCSRANCLVTEVTETTGIYKDKPVKTFGVETTVLEQKDGVWRIVHVHWSSHK